LHLERLKLIAQLQDRGLRIDAIRDLLAQVDRGELDAHAWLGLDAQLQSSWAADQPRALSEAELYELAGTKRAGLVAELVRARLVERRGDAFLVRSPALFQVAMRLDASGVDLSTATASAEIVRKHMARAASDLADHFFAHAGDGFGRSATPEDLREAFETLKPVGLDAVRVIFAQEMGRVLRRLVASGKTAKLRPKKKR
jgi:DNA-binding transcriptional MerR regulator